MKKVVMRQRLMAYQEHVNSIWKRLWQWRDSWHIKSMWIVYDRNKKCLNLLVEILIIENQSFCQYQLKGYSSGNYIDVIVYPLSRPKLVCYVATIGLVTKLVFHIKVFSFLCTLMAPLLFPSTSWLTARWKKD